MAYSIVTVYGMNDEIGNISYYDSKQSDYNFNKPYSDATADKIDQEVKKLIDQVYQNTLGLLTKHKAKLEIVAQELLEKEIIFQNDLERLIGKRPFEHQTSYEAFTNGQRKVETPPENNDEKPEDDGADKPINKDISSELQSSESPTAVESQQDDTESTKSE